MTGRKDPETWGSKESEREGKREPEKEDRPAEGGDPEKVRSLISGCGAVERGEQVGAEGAGVRRRKQAGLPGMSGVEGGFGVGM